MATYSVTCFLEYSDCLYSGFRPAQQAWPTRVYGAAARRADAVAAALATSDPDVVVTRVVCASGELRGHLPGGLAA
jgi:hypothetical protein